MINCIGAGMLLLSVFVVGSLIVVVLMFVVTVLLS